MRAWGVWLGLGLHNGHTGYAEGTGKTNMRSRRNDKNVRTIGDASRARGFSASLGEVSKGTESQEGLEQGLMESWHGLNK